MSISKPLNEAHSLCSNNKLLEYRLPGTGDTTFHFDCVRPALVDVEVLFCLLCIFHCDCAFIARQAFQYSGSVAYLFPLTVATVLDGDAVCISDRSRHLTSNLTVHARINYLCWQVFSIATVPLELESVCGVYSFVARVSSW